MGEKDRYAGGPAARYLLFGSTLGLLLLGLVMVYSASTASDIVNFSDSAHHLKRQLMWIAVGLLALFVAKAVDYHRIRSTTWPFYLVSIVGLVVVLIMGVGKWGATRWIDVGGFTIQPSEYAKLACVMVTAHLFAQVNERKLKMTEFWGREFLSFALVAGLVMLQPDMGTTMSIAFAIFAVLLLGGIDWRIVVGIVGGGAGVAALGIMLAPYRMARLFAFIDPWADPQGGGYQTIQALLAFGSGGWHGVGLGMSRQKFFYLPAAHTDFIFAIIGEELGLIGTLAVVLAFAVFTYAGIRIALGARDTFGRLLAGGVTAMIGTQALMNMAAVTGLMPVTGIPMPLVSYGGSSMTFTMLCIGIILSVSSNGTRGVRAVRGPNRTKENLRARDDERRGNRRPHLSGIDGGRSSSRKRA